MSILSFNSEASGARETSHLATALINVAYGNHAAQHMDIYLPANRSVTKTKSLILIHGGGWNSGSRASFTSYIDSFKRRMPNYAIFNIDYRLVKAYMDFPEQQNDIKTAVDFITSHADKYEINPARLVLLGVSAGGHLALLQAYKHNSPKIAAVIDFFGPTDLLSMYNKPWNPMIPHLMKTLLNGSPRVNASAYENASPANFISAKTPPTLLFHGRQDYIVDISQSELLHQKLEQAGVANKMVVYNHSGHGWYGNTLSDSFDKIEAFLDQYLP